jgi:CcmD family protein
MSSGEGYLAAAYVVVLAIVLVYLVIHSLRLARMERQIAELAERSHNG